MSLNTEVFTIQNKDELARTAVLRLPNGTVETPVFMPVGTQATVKSLDPAEVSELGAQIILANTYHLMLRPGSDLVEQMGGVASFMRWNGPVLTDSGGFQVFSLARRREITSQGVVFRSHIDGSRHTLTPERSISIQQQLGADVSMALDVCSGYDDPDEQQLSAMNRTHDWLDSNISAFNQHVDTSKSCRPLLFGICQGGFDADRRTLSAEFISESQVDGLAIGGLSVGEPKPVLAEMLAASIAGLDEFRPRYLMGVGSPEDLWNAVAAGVDMFDCVLPTRTARHGGLYTPQGRINIRAARYRTVQEPPDPTCDCSTCQRFSCAYIHHLFRAGELLAYRLASIHNLRFLVRQMETIRNAIRAENFRAAHAEFQVAYVPTNQQARLKQRRQFRSNAGSSR